MAMDEAMNARVRQALGKRGDVTEKGMFGGLCFLVGGNMLCGVQQDHLLFRVGQEHQAEALARPGARIMEMNGRRMVGFIFVEPGACAGSGLAAWLRLATEYVEQLPAKQSAKKKKFAGLSGAVAVLCCGWATLAGSPSMHSGYAPVNGLQMYYEIHGEPDGKPPLVLLHGGGSTIETSWGAVLPELAQHRQIIAFEQQGHGHTADVDRPFSFKQSADDAIALLKYLGFQQADFWGYSNGGHICIEIALRHPQAVRKLVIQSAMFNRAGSDAPFWEGFKHARLQDMPVELKEAYLKSAPHREQLQSFFDKCVARMAQFKGWSRAQIRSIKVPTLVILGDHDIMRPEHAVEMIRLLPDARLAVLPGTNHMNIVHHADWLVSMAEEFLDSSDATTKPANQ